MCSTLWILEVSLPHRAIGMRNTRLRESSVISRVKAHGLPVHVAPTLAVVRRLWGQPTSCHDQIWSNSLVMKQKKKGS